MLRKFKNLLVVLVALTFGVGLKAVPTAPLQSPTGVTQSEPPGAFVTVNGARLWYRIEGQGEPLVLIPGGPGNPHTGFLPEFSKLADTARVVYFDPFGRGKSDRAKAPTEYSLERDVEDLEGLRTALNLGPINVLGRSYGGIVAQAYALKYPASIKRLILASSFHSTEMWQQGLNDTWNFEIRNQFPEIWEKLLALRRGGRLSGDPEYQTIQGEVPGTLFYYYDPSNSRRPSYADSSLNLDVYVRISGPDADVLLGGSLGSFDFREHLRTIAVPILITAGRFDRVAIPRYAIQFRDYAPHAQFVMFEHSGHFADREEPDAYFDILRRFLRT